LRGHSGGGDWVGIGLVDGYGGGRGEMGADLPRRGGRRGHYVWVNILDGKLFKSS